MCKSKDAQSTCTKSKYIKTNNPLQVVHSDICGPMNVNSIGGSKYVLTITDDYTKYVTAYYLKNKSDALSKFQEFVNMAENAAGYRVQTIRTDNGGEYATNQFKLF